MWAFISAGDYFFPAPACRLRKAGTRGVKLNFHGSQPGRAADPYRREPDRLGDHGAAAYPIWTHVNRALRAAPLHRRGERPTIRSSV